MTGGRTAAHSGLPFGSRGHFTPLERAHGFAATVIAAC